MKVLPNAIAPHRGRQRRDDGHAVLFVGALGHPPNEDAVCWFVESIWPRLARVGALRLQVAGAHPSAAIERLGRKPGIEILGWTADLAPLYARATVCIAPLRMGAGTRFKLLESAVHGVPIISTSLGAEGLGLRDGRELWLADQPAAFAAAMRDALERPIERQRRANAARRSVLRRFDRATTIRRLANEFAALL